MARKKRMVKSTYMNELRTGSFWICHNEYHVVLNNALQIIEKNDVVIILGFTETIYKDVRVVKCHSQKMNIIFSTTIEEFYFNYNKM